MKLQSIRVQNFKALIDSRVVKLGPLAVFVGNNGSGKSSLIEALETYQAIVLHGLDAAMNRWLGIEHVRHKASQAVSPIIFKLAIGSTPRKVTRCELQIGNDAAANNIYIKTEEIFSAPDKRVSQGTYQAQILGTAVVRKLVVSASLLSAPQVPFVAEVANHIAAWQFLTLQPEVMGVSQPQQRTGGGVRLRKDGSNIADYLLEIRKLSIPAFEGIVQAMAYVLPYARDLQAAVTSELERKAYLQLTESDFKVPGWMLSTGTLRVLALLAVLRHPNPPPLIVIEEIENGLDPRSIHLLIEEIRSAVTSGVTQVILTTHSPYLLDLLKLDQITLVARDASGEPSFHRPNDSDSLRRWALEFAPGRLYTMGKLHEAAQ